MKLAVRVAATAALAALGACSGSVGYTPPHAAPTAVPVHREFTLYAFANPRGEYGLPPSPKQDGRTPRGSLTFVDQRAGLVLYGRTAAGGNTSGCGTMFSILTSGKQYRVLYRFSGPDGCSPRHDAMIPDPVFGFLWSSTEGRTDKTVKHQRVYNDGQILAFNIIQNQLSIVHRFTGAPGDGSRQRSSFSFNAIPGPGSMLYGQSANGGRHNEGEIYSAALGSSTTKQLFSFTKPTGYEPHGRIVLLGSTLWGITRRGGEPDGNGGGVVFKFPLATPSPALSPAPPTTALVVHVFRGNGRNSDGFQSNHGYLTPVPARRASPADTILYGMTTCGGKGGGADVVNCDGRGDGVIFQIDANALAYSTFHQFRGTEFGDGADPFGSLLYDPASGYLYGTTRNGGAADQGTVFRIAPGRLGSTGRTEILYSFSGQAGDGANPIDNVILVNGILYGLTTKGGASSNAGTIFGVRLPR